MVGKSKHGILVEKYGSDPNIVVLRGLPYDFTHGMGESFIWWIAPKNGIYTIEGLNRFMDSLVPIEPTERKNFMAYGRSVFVGSLTFEEESGRERVVAERTRLSVDGSPKGEPEREESVRTYHRYDTVKVFPDVPVGTEAISSRDFVVPMRYLERMHRISKAKTKVGKALAALVPF